MTEPDDLLEALASLPSYHHPTVAPDGDRIAVYYDISGRNELHLIDVESGERTQLSDGEVPRNARWGTRWGPHGDRIYFHLDEDGNEQNDIYAIDLDGTVEPVVEMEGQLALQAIADDGTLYFGSSAGGQMNIYRLGPENAPDDEPEKLTTYNRAVWGCELSPDGDRIAYSTNESDEFENRDVYVANADGSEPRNLEIGDVGAEASPADWGPEGDRLLVSDNTDDLMRPGVYDCTADEVTWYGDLDGEEQPVEFLPDGDRFLALRTREAAIMPVVYDVETGESTELSLPEGVATFGALYGGSADATIDDNRVMLSHTTPTDRPQLLVYDLSNDDCEVLIEPEYGDVDPDLFADAEYFRFESDGIPETHAAAVDHDPYETLEIEALLYDSGERPSPLIVNPHGGPRAADFRRFDLYTQFLLTRGYSVLQVNYRGSMGRGREFAEELYDDWGGAEQGDVAVAAEHVIDRYDWIDDDRVVVFGGSYGGYSAYWQMIQYPELYDAGIAWIGVSDLPDMFENTMPHFRTELMEKYLGTPEENPTLYEERSPSTHAENLAAPLLIVHGVNDRRVPVSQARIFRDRLETAGLNEGVDGEFEYVELGEEGHASSDIDQKIRMFRTLDDFLDRRIQEAPEISAE